MAYEQKPGNGSAFKNDKKEKETHADWKGTYKDESGNDYWFNMWEKMDKNGNKYFSFSLKRK